MRRLGFTLTAVEPYARALGEGTLDGLLAGACSCSSTQRRRLPLGGARTVPDGTSVYVKHWVPREAHHRIKTLWAPSKIEREAAQYARFERAGLPVAEFILAGARRLPFPRRGSYLTGLLVGSPWTVRGIARRTVGATD